MTANNFYKKISLAKTIGLDTMIFIYLLEGHKTYFHLVKPIFELMEKGKLKIVSSFISYIETLSSPRLDSKKIELYSKFFLKSKNLFLKKVDWPISDLSANIRRTYGLRTPDAIQISTAIVNDANLFISNDDSFKKIKDIKTLVLKDFV